MDEYNPWNYTDGSYLTGVMSLGLTTDRNKLKGLTDIWSKYAGKTTQTTYLYGFDGEVYGEVFDMGNASMIVEQIDTHNGKDLGYSTPRDTEDIQLAIDRGVEAAIRAYVTHNIPAEDILAGMGA